MTSYHGNFASHHTCDHHVGFLFAWPSIEKHNKMFWNFYLGQTMITNYNYATKILHLKKIFENIDSLNPGMKKIRSDSVFCWFSVYRTVQNGNQGAWQNHVHVCVSRHANPLFHSGQNWSSKNVNYFQQNSHKPKYTMQHGFKKADLIFAIWICFSQYMIKFTLWCYIIQLCI